MCQFVGDFTYYLYTLGALPWFCSITVSTLKPEYDLMPPEGICPSNINGIPVVKYGNPPKCYTAGHLGPCGEHEILMQEKPGFTKGICICECMDNDGSIMEAHMQETGRFSSCRFNGPRMCSQTYDKEARKCESNWDDEEDDMSIEIVADRRCPSGQRYSYSLEMCVFSPTVDNFQLY